MRSFMMIISSFFLLLTACQETEKKDVQEKTVKEIKEQGGISNADIIRNPVTANAPTDTVNVAKIVFEEHVHEFGTVEEGDVVEHIFKFTNTGKIPLVISNARSTCGCTVPEWPQDPIEAGGSGSIKVKFNTKGKKGNQKKPVTITANTYPQKSIVHVQGQVNPSNEKTN